MHRYMQGQAYRADRRKQVQTAQTARLTGIQNAQKFFLGEDGIGRRAIEIVNKNVQKAR